MTTTPYTDGTELAAKIERKELSALEAIDSAIARAEAMNPKLNFLVSDTFERARDRARAGGLTGPFAGVPYLVKDMYDVAGVITRWGTRATAILPPATTDSPQVQAMEAAGLVIIGKTSLGEFGFLPTTEPLAFGPTRNPWDPTRTPGGSSGGSAVAVAAGVVPMADAADGGGSIRIPASACGLFGLKPSRGRMVGEQTPAAGYDVTVEHGLTRSVRDSARLFAAMERTGTNTPLPPVGVVAGPSSRRLRVGYLAVSMVGREPDPEVSDALDTTASLLEQLGHRVEPTVAPFDAGQFSQDFAALWAAAAAEVVALFRELATVEPDESMLEPLTLAMSRLSQDRGADDLDAVRARLDTIGPRYQQWFEELDVILSPVLAQPPVLVGAIAGDVTVEDMIDRLDSFAAYTPLHNIVGAPAMSVPLAWTDSGLPVGSHFAARTGDERSLFELAYELEEALPWGQHRPAAFASAPR